MSKHPALTIGCEAMIPTDRRSSWRADDDIGSPVSDSINTPSSTIEVTTLCMSCFVLLLPVQFPRVRIKPAIIGRLKVGGSSWLLAAGSQVEP